jgi:hypothetical protein
MSRNLATRIFATFVLISFCGTIPVLTVAHWHHLGAGGGPSLVAPSEKNRTSEDNPLTCSLCARIVSSVSFVTPTVVFLSIHPLFETPSHRCESGVRSVRFSPCLDRAPPTAHTA